MKDNIIVYLRTEQNRLRFGSDGFDEEAWQYLKARYEAEGLLCNAHSVTERIRAYKKLNERTKDVKENI